MRIAPGLHRAGSDLVAVYLVEEGGRVTVIDAGLPGLWRDLLAELDSMGRSLQDVAAVLLTHGDTDHLGFAELQTFRGGDVLDLPGSPRVVHLPGHTDGSVAFHVPLVDAVMVGDAMTTRNVLTGVTGPQPAPFTLEPARALDSLSALAEVDARWVLPGHGPSWDGGAAEAVARVRTAATC